MRPWVIDGSEAGTRPLLESTLTGLTASGRQAFAATAEGELWRSDGTAAGTALLAGGLSVIDALTVAAGRAFFFARDGRGTELWTSDGTPAGIRPLTAFVPADPFANDSWLKPIAGRVYFVADDGVNGQELWRSDGTPGGTRRGTAAGFALGASARTPRPPDRIAAPALAELPLVSQRTDPADAVPCQPGPRRLCLNGGRFAVTAAWKDFGDRTGDGTALPLTNDTGAFWFFAPDNLEVLVKVLDGRPLNGKFWVFYGALSNVEYELTVTDTETGTSRTYRNPRGRFASAADTAAF